MVDVVQLSVLPGSSVPEMVTEPDKSLSPKLSPANVTDICSERGPLRGELPEMMGASNVNQSWRELVLATLCTVTARRKSTPSELVWFGM